MVQDMEVDDMMANVFATSEEDDFKSTWELFSFKIPLVMFEIEFNTPTGMFSPPVTYSIERFTAFGDVVP